MEFGTEIEEEVIIRKIRQHWIGIAIFVLSSLCVLIYGSFLFQWTLPKVPQNRRQSWSLLDGRYGIVTLFEPKGFPYHEQVQEAVDYYNRIEPTFVISRKKTESCIVLKHAKEAKERSIIANTAKTGKREDYIIFYDELIKKNHENVYHVALHELGHTVGIKHNKAENSVFNAYQKKGQIITAEDRFAINQALKAHARESLVMGTILHPTAMAKQEKQKKEIMAALKAGPQKITMPKK